MSTALVSAPEPVRPRRGLVLGAGGPLGAAWMIGALCALEEVAGFDPRTSDVVIGTSAGAVLAALLGAGASPADMRDHQLGVAGAGGPLAGRDFDYGSTGGSWPGWPRVGIGSFPLLARWARSPRRFSPLVPLAAVAPPARAALRPIRGLIDSLGPGGAWSAHPGVRVVSMDYDTGERVVFGSDARRWADRRAGLSDAVSASCAVPGWFAPVVIGERRYVDGAVLSPAHADLAVGLGLDEVYVLAPMASDELDEPASMTARCERQLRRLMTRQVLREANALHQDGTKAVLIAPGPADLESMGGNLMDPARRIPVLRTSLATSAAALRAVTHPRAAALPAG